MSVDLVKIEKGLRASPRARTMPRGEVVAALGSLVGVGVVPDGDGRAAPARGAQLGPHRSTALPSPRVAFEVLAQAEPEVLVGRAAKQ